jgi:DNA-binding transcriptional LysR family regulator
MDTQALAAFVAIADHQSFSRAADQLHLTQPAISKRLATLEQQLNVRLFDRIGRSISLTEAGLALLPRARNVLHELRDAQLSIQNLSGHVGGALRMGISHHIGLHHLPPLLQQFSQTHPAVKCDIEFLDSEEAYERVAHGDVELGIITLAPENAPNIQQFSIWRDDLRITVANTHPLSQFPSASLKQLSQYPAILPGLNTYTGQIIEKLFAEKKLPLDVIMSTNYLETIKAMVSIGLGWSVLPTTLADESMHTMQISGQKLSRQLGCVYHRNRSLSNAAKAFLDLLKKAAKDQK